MLTLTSNLDDTDLYPDETIDSVDENGDPLIGNSGLTCAIVEANGEGLCETSDPPINPFEHCVFCGGGDTIPNRARQAIVE